MSKKSRSTAALLTNDAQEGDWILPRPAQQALIAGRVIVVTDVCAVVRWYHLFTRNGAVRGECFRTPVSYPGNQLLTAFDLTTRPALRARGFAPADGW